MFNSKVQLRPLYLAKIWRIGEVGQTLTFGYSHIDIQTFRLTFGYWHSDMIDIRILLTFRHSDVGQTLTFWRSDIQMQKKKRKKEKEKLRILPSARSCSDLQILPLALHTQSMGQLVDLVNFSSSLYMVMRNSRNLGLVVCLVKNFRFSKTDSREV